jgi:hypothetical protein
MKWRDKRGVSVLRGMGSPYIPERSRGGYVQARGRTYPVQTDLAISEKLRKH